MQRKIEIKIAGGKFVSLDSLQPATKSCPLFPDGLFFVFEYRQWAHSPRRFRTAGTCSEVSDLSVGSLQRNTKHTVSEVRLLWFKFWFYYLISE